MNQTFYDLLYDELAKDDSTENENNCLITYEPLEDDHVKLFCGHSFNYRPIFDEVYQQKHNKPSTEKKILRTSQIKCPYCRHIQNKLLPHNDKYASIYKVNHPINCCMKPNYCSYIFKSGKKKGIMCNKNCFEKYCNIHMKSISKSSVVKDNNSNTCKHILERGKNKGNTCSKKSYQNSDYCKIHLAKHTK